MFGTDPRGGADPSIDVLPLGWDGRLLFFWQKEKKMHPPVHRPLSNPETVLRQF